MTIGYTATKNSLDYLTFIYAGQATMLGCLPNSRFNMPTQSWKCDAVETASCCWGYGVRTKITPLDIVHLYVAYCSHDMSLEIEIHYAGYKQ